MSVSATISPADAMHELKSLLSPKRYEQSLARAARRKALRLWGDDPVGFCNRLAWGADYEAQPPREYKVTLRPWQAGFIRELATAREEPHREIVLKSRGVGASWAAMWYATWLLWARAPTQILLMSDVEDKAWDLMRRHRLVAKRLPPEIGYPVPAKGDADNLSSRVFPNGSEIHSLSGNPDSIHTYHPSLIVLDEAAYLRDDPRAALVGTKADIVVMSTANGFGNPFQELWEDAYSHGGVEWGYSPRFVSWRERGDLTERPKGSPAVIQQEYPDSPEEAFVASSANLHRLDDDRLVEPFIVPWQWPVMAVHDPGVDTGAWLWLARVSSPQGPMRAGDLYACEEWDPAGRSISEQVADYKGRASRLRVVRSVIDPSAHTRTHGGDRWLRIADLFAERGVHFGDGSNDVRAGVMVIGDAIEGRRLWFSRALSRTISDVRSATMDNLADKHFYACLRYGMLASPERMAVLADTIPPPRTNEEVRGRRMAIQIDKMETGDEDYETP